MKIKEEKVNPLDWKYMEQNPDGDPGFDPEANQRVIDETIAWTEKNYRAKKNEFDQAAKERSEAAAMYVRSLDNGETTSALKYFGRRELARLRGEEVLNKIKATKEMMDKAKEKVS